MDTSRLGADIDGPQSHVPDEGANPTTLTRQEGQTVSRSNVNLTAPQVPGIPILSGDGNEEFIEEPKTPGDDIEVAKFNPDIGSVVGKPIPGDFEQKTKYYTNYMRENSMKLRPRKHTVVGSMHVGPGTNLEGEESEWATGLAQSSEEAAATRDQAVRTDEDFEPAPQTPKPFATTYDLSSEEFNKELNSFYGEGQTAQPSASVQTSTTQIADSAHGGTRQYLGPSMQTGDHAIQEDNLRAPQDSAISRDTSDAFTRGGESPPEQEYEPLDLVDGNLVRLNDHNHDLLHTENATHVGDDAGATGPEKSPHIDVDRSSDEARRRRVPASQRVAPESLRVTTSPSPNSLGNQVGGQAAWEATPAKIQASLLQESIDRVDHEIRELQEPFARQYDPSHAVNNNVADPKDYLQDHYHVGDFANLQDDTRVVAGQYRPIPQCGTASTAGPTNHGQISDQATPRVFADNNERSVPEISTPEEVGGIGEPLQGFGQSMNSFNSQVDIGPNSRPGSNILAPIAGPRSNDFLTKLHASTRTRVQLPGNVNVPAGPTASKEFSPAMLSRNTEANGATPIASKSDEPRKEVRRRLFSGNGPSAPIPGQMVMEELGVGEQVFVLSQDMKEIPALKRGINLSPTKCTYPVPYPKDGNFSGPTAVTPISAASAHSLQPTFGSISSLFATKPAHSQAATPSSAGLVPTPRKTNQHSGLYNLTPTPAPKVFRGRAIPGEYLGVWKPDYSSSSGTENTLAGPSGRGGNVGVPFGGHILEGSRLGGGLQSGDLGSRGVFGSGVENTGVGNNGIPNISLMPAGVGGLYMGNTDVRHTFVGNTTVGNPGIFDISLAPAGVADPGMGNTGFDNSDFGYSNFENAGVGNASSTPMGYLGFGMNFENAGFRNASSTPMGYPGFDMDFGSTFFTTAGFGHAGAGNTPMGNTPMGNTRGRTAHMSNTRGRTARVPDSITQYIPRINGRGGNIGLGNTRMGSNLRQNTRIGNTRGQNIRGGTTNLGRSGLNFESGVPEDTIVVQTSSSGSKGAKTKKRSGRSWSDEKEEDAIFVAYGDGEDPNDGDWKPPRKRVRRSGSTTQGSSAYQRGGGGKTRGPQK